MGGGVKGCGVRKLGVVASGTAWGRMLWGERTPCRALSAPFDDTRRGLIRRLLRHCGDYDI